MFRAIVALILIYTSELNAEVNGVALGMFERLIYLPKECIWNLPGSASDKQISLFKCEVDDNELTVIVEELNLQKLEDIKTSTDTISYSKNEYNSIKHHDFEGLIINTKAYQRVYIDLFCDISHCIVVLGESEYVSIYIGNQFDSEPNKNSQNGQ